MVCDTIQIYAYKKDLFLTLIKSYDFISEEIVLKEVLDLIKEHISL